MRHIIKLRYETHSQTYQLLGHESMSLINVSVSVPKMLWLEVFLYYLMMEMIGM